MSDKKIPIVETQMLIRRSAALVFEAFVDPHITANFWFTSGTGLLEEGKNITWEWEMYGISVSLMVKEIIRNKKIVIEWGTPSTTVEFNFDAITEDTTYVIIRNYGFQQTDNELIEVIKDNTGGFTTVLDGLKAYLEHNIKLNLIADKFPHKG